MEAEFWWSIFLMSNTVYSKTLCLIVSSNYSADCTFSTLRYLKTLSVQLHQRCALHHPLTRLYLRRDIVINKVRVFDNFALKKQKQKVLYKCTVFGFRILCVSFNVFSVLIYFARSVLILFT